MTRLVMIAFAALAISSVAASAQTRVDIVVPGKAGVIHATVPLVLGVTY